MFTQTITVEPWLSKDKYGQPSFGPGVARTCRIEGKNKLVRALDGQERVSATTIYVYGAAGIGYKDRVTLPDGSRPIILAVEQMPDDHGDYYEAIYTGAAGD